MSTMLPAQQAVDVENVERLIRRLPRVVHEVRSRFDNVQSDRALSELIRALLPIYFDDVYPLSRTPNYSAATRIDYRLARARIVIVGHRLSRTVGEEQYLARLEEDAREFAAEDIDTLVVFAYDPEERIREPDRIEATGSRTVRGLPVICLVT